MKRIKPFLLRIFFMLEIVAFGYVYLFGLQGLQVLMALKKEDKQLEVRIDKIQHEVVALQEEHVTWQKYSFYKEKFAREHLQMAHKDDEIYYIS